MYCVSFLPTSSVRILPQPLTVFLPPIVFDFVLVCMDVCSYLLFPVQTRPVVCRVRAPAFKSINRVHVHDPLWTRPYNQDNTRESALTACFGHTHRQRKHCMAENALIIPTGTSAFSAMPTIIVPTISLLSQRGRPHA